MLPLNKFIVKIDPDFLSKTSSGLHQALPTGTKYYRLPTHGTLIGNLENSGIPDNSTVYFHHFAIDTLFRYKGCTYVTPEPSHIIAYEGEDGLKGYARCVSKRVYTEAHVTNEKALITRANVQKYETHKFEIISNPTDIPVKTGDTVWIYTNTDYIIHYKDDISFLDPPYVVYNETEDEVIEPWVLIQTYDNESGFEENSLGLLVPRKIKRHKNQARVKKDSMGLRAGDEILFNKTSHNVLPIFNDGSIVNFKYIRAYV